MDRGLTSILDALARHEERLSELSEITLANLVMIAEIPAPTFSESQRMEFLLERFNEYQLQNCSTDEAGNALGILPGEIGDRKILVVAHMDTVFPETEDYTVTIQPGYVTGLGIGDNSLGVASVATLPIILEQLGIRLDSNLILMGSAQSLGRGKIQGIRFFLGNTEVPISAGICVEGVKLGRLSYSSFGMVRGEIHCDLPDEYDWTRFGAGGAIVTMNEVINRVQEIPLPRRPRTTIVFNSMEAGAGFNTVPTRGSLQFEVRSESAGLVTELGETIENIGKEVVIFRSELQQRYPLLDEIAVIDSGSADRTFEVAASFGADTYLASDILPNVGPKRGKGENLWKAIYQLKGDIIVCIDADIKNIHPRFVYGLVAPLIHSEEIKYVKAFYDRPLAFSGGVRPSGGGRVTEILIRPLFSLFFPELTAIIQPLSGEYAVRREVLEAIPFPIGYGVETSHLLDVYSRWGMSAFAQTDLDQRVHRNQPTRSLGKMSFGILQTFLSRLEQLKVIGEVPEMSTILRQFQVKDQLFETVEFEIFEEERPPMLDVPEYRERIGRKVDV